MFGTVLLTQRAVYESQNCLVQGCLKTLGHQIARALSGQMFESLPPRCLATEGDPHHKVLTSSAHRRENQEATKPSTE